MARVPYLNSLSKLANADALHGIARSPYHDSFVVDRIEEALKQQNESRISQVRLPRVQRSQSMLYAAQIQFKSTTTRDSIYPQDNAQDSDLSQSSGYCTRFVQSRRVCFCQSFGSVNLIATTIMTLIK